MTDDKILEQLHEPAPQPETVPAEVQEVKTESINPREAQE